MKYIGDTKYLYTSYGFKGVGTLTDHQQGNEIISSLQVYMYTPLELENDQETAAGQHDLCY